MKIAAVSSLSPRLRQVSPLAPRIPAIARHVPVKSHRRATVGAPHLLFLSGFQLCSNCFRTLPCAIKEEKKNEERVGHSGVEKEKGETSTERREKRFLRVSFLFFFEHREAFGSLSFILEKMVVFGFK